ncbi:MAG: hypothetical protein JSV55_05105 [Deltaproteobacteria bacterium]|nr:MAG: hypothetical protein JSV55_05105 [Deltaproteobacteria bacterium]
MKCPKCKYVTFDYLDTCPRCGKNMASEKAKYNISGLKPNPPFVLGSLTGDLNESEEEVAITASMRETAAGGGYKDEGVYDDGSELDINIDEGSMTDAENVTEIDLGDLGVTDEEDVGADVDFEPDAEDDEQKQKTEADLGDLDLDLSDVDLSLDIEDDEGSKK